jgi:hypothetical protein
MAVANNLRWSTLDEVYAAARTFLDPVLESGVGATWDPESWLWQPREAAGL